MCAIARFPCGHSMLDFSICDVISVRYLKHLFRRLSLSFPYNRETHIRYFIRRGHSWRSRYFLVVKFFIYRKIFSALSISLFVFQLTISVPSSNKVPRYLGTRSRVQSFTSNFFSLTVLFSDFTRDRSLISK